MGTKFPFYKMQGCGNDFVVAWKSELPADIELGAFARSICRRHYGVGSDGLLLVGDSQSKAIVVNMYNPDGSEMGMCGNGIRCVARFLYLEGAVDSGVSEIGFEVFKRPIHCHSLDQGKTVRVDMGAVSFDPAIIPIASSQSFREHAVSLGNRVVKGIALSIGNPHFVVFEKLQTSEQPQILGAALEINEFFPQRTNVEFVTVRSTTEIDVIVWERGAGLTLACGTGACAAVAAGIKSGLLASPCRVNLPGGSVEVEWDSSTENASVFLLGEAQEVFHGEFHL